MTRDERWEKELARALATRAATPCPGEAPLVAFYRGELSEAESEPLRDHLASCGACVALARDARANLPSRVNQPSDLTELRIPIPDRTGAAAEIFTLAAELGVNLASFEVVHSLEGSRGIAIMLVDASMADLYRGGLIARGYRPAVQRLE